MSRILYCNLFYQYKVSCLTSLSERKKSHNRPRFVQTKPNAPRKEDRKPTWAVEKKGQFELENGQQCEMEK